jgi:type II secretion system (T2SS) protein M
MRTLSPREKRTIRIGAIVAAAYLVLFFGYEVLSYFGHRRAEYEKLLAEARHLKQEVRVHEGRAMVAKKLMENFRMDPARLNKPAVVAEASAAIQKVAGEGGVSVGSIRESPARPSSKELASMQIELNGSAPAISAMLHRMESVGYPVIIDSVQITAEPSRPGQIKLNLTLVILDFEQWKEEAPHA